MSKLTALRYDGTGSLTFVDGSGARRTIQHHGSFEVDRSTADTLLGDPFVVPADAPPSVPVVTGVTIEVEGGRPPEVQETLPQIDVATAKKPELADYATLLGLELGSRASAEDLRLAIEAELTRRQAHNLPLVNETVAALVTDDGETVPVEPGTVVTVEAVPATPSGVVTLGDLPPSAKAKG